LPNFVLNAHTGDSRDIEKAVLPTQLSECGLSERYEEFKLQVPPGIQLLDIVREQLADLAESIIQHEGPIHVEEVARRIREAFGLGRTGRRISDRICEALEQVARQRKIVRDGDFWSATNSVLKSPRCRRETSISLRRSDRIAPAEYRLAIESVLRSAVAVSSPEITVGVARILGFDRTGNGLGHAISAQIDVMIQAGQIRATEGKLQLT
jgi:hypothetical protein